jgi:RNA polymerase sigma-70 factor (ECF subfamily)
LKDLSSKNPENDLNPEKWVHLYGDYLYNFAFSRLKDQGAAEDVVQETFLAALKSKDSFTGKSSTRTWLVGILRHKIVDYLRRVFRDQPVGKDEAASPEDSYPFIPSGRFEGHWYPDRGPVDWGNNPAAFLEQKEFWEILEFCIKKLPQRLASVFVLYQMEEISTEVICKELRITATNLWVILHRTRSRLRRCLEINWIEGKPTSRRPEANE